MPSTSLRNRRFRRRTDPSRQRRARRRGSRLAAVDRFLPRRDAPPDFGARRARGPGPHRRGGRHRHPDQPWRRGAWLAGRATGCARHRHEVVCNQGGKGVPARAIIDRHGASSAVFVDDLAVHHASVAKHAPEVWRLHMVAEPRLAGGADRQACPCADRRLADRLRMGPRLACATVTPPHERDLI